ncbi:hypothetical protein ACFT8W_13225 [Streptomyces hygroscopicus]|uniref:hypothetical protein n=1 Tax=Streptomyces hygroscopicus TaxID=1912 RepID=UPI003640ADA5
MIIKLTNSPASDDASPPLFRTSMGNILTAAQKARVGHVVILSDPVTPDVLEEEGGEGVAEASCRRGHHSVVAASASGLFHSAVIRRLRPTFDLVDFGY